MLCRAAGAPSAHNNSGNPLLHVAEEGAYDQYNARIPGYSCLDLTAVWHVMKQLSVRTGVNNVFDKDPPIVPSLDISGNAGPANSFDAYDYLGWQVFIAFSAKF
jgi:iron complex outermembrane receptor protein